MCRRTKKIAPRRDPIRIRKKKKSCYQRCCVACFNKISRCICRRIRRWMKKEIFGDPNPHLDEYEVVGVNLGSIKDKVFPKKDPSITSLIKQNRKMTKLYLSDLDLIKGRNAEKLGKKFALSPSKAKVLDKLIEDYKKGRLSVSAMPDKPKSKARKLNKERLNKIIDKYDEKKYRNKTRSSKIIEKLREMDPNDLKKKFSLTDSRHRVLEHMVNDYKKRKVSFKRLSDISKFSSRKLSKDQVNQMLRDYEQKKKLLKLPSRLPFTFTSKLFNRSIMSIINELKNKISISSLTKKVYDK